MLNYIKKRNGDKVEFNKDKIKTAILKAAKAVDMADQQLAAEITREVVSYLKIFFKNEGTPSVEQVQDLVEKTLIENGSSDIAKAYILYRDQHSKIRHTEELFDDAIESTNDYLDRSDWKVNENSNMGYSLQGLNNHISSEVTAQYWLQEIYPKEIRDRHSAGDLHIHDLGNLSVYCCGWDLKDLLINGFGGVATKVESKPPKHFRTALMQSVNFLYTLQGEAAGAMAFSNFDTYLAPFIAYDDLNYEEVKQAMQEFIYNLNVPTRVGFQTPFTNITMDLKVPNNIKDEPVVIGGEHQDETYADFQEEMDMLNKAFAEVMLEGDKKGRVFSFPIPTYNITSEFDWDNELLDPIWEMTAKYGIPYFSNFVNSDMNPDDIRSMCPLGGKEKVLIKSTRYSGLEYSTIQNIYNGNGKEDQIYEVYSDGQFVKGKFNKFDNQDMVKVKLTNGHEIKMSKSHLNFVKKDKTSPTEELTGNQLEKDYYLPYSLEEHQGTGGTYELGYFIGAFAGDGSFDRESHVVFSLGEGDKEETIDKLINIVEDYFGASYSLKDDYEDTKLITLRINSKAAVGLCKDFVASKKRDKHYKARLYTMSKKFRQGVIAGHYATDGGNRNRIYTSSEKMIESLNMLAATLGTTTSIYKDDRPGRYGPEPNYAVLIYQLNRNSYGDIWFKEDNKLWVQIDEIESASGSVAYCLEVIDDDPMFTIGTTGVLTHNCRLRIDNTELRKRGGGLFGSNPLTGSVGVVTLNMPRIGYQADSKEEFIEQTYQLMDVARDSLEIKREVLENLTDQGLYPYSKFYLRDIKQRFDEYWKNHFNTIGLNGLNEALVNFMGQNISTPEGQEFAVEVMEAMRDKLVDYQEKTGNIYNLEATPAEGTSYRFAKGDKEKFGSDIVCANQDRVEANDADPYYTNSSQLPVGYTDDIFEAFQLQDPLQKLYTGGTVLHGFVGEKMPSIKSTKKLVKRLAHNFELPYYSITPSFSICPKHGYIAGEHEYCPKCDAEIGYEEGE
jgi:ribonucleoside-triphosphate reductase